MINIWGEEEGVVSPPSFSVPVRVAVLGARSWAAPELVSSFVSGLPRGSVVLSGDASGVDAFAVRAALVTGLSVAVWPAPWALGLSAGPRRSAALLRSVGPVGAPASPVVRASVVSSSWLELRAGEAPACPGPVGGVVAPVAACVVFSSLGPSSPGSVAAVAAARRAGVRCFVCSPAGVWSRG